MQLRRTSTQVSRGVSSLREDHGVADGVQLRPHAPRPPAQTAGPVQALQCRAGAAAGSAARLVMVPQSHVPCLCDVDGSHAFQDSTQGRRVQSIGSAERARGQLQFADSTTPTKKWRAICPRHDCLAGSSGSRLWCSLQLLSVCSPRWWWSCACPCQRDAPSEWTSLPFLW